MNKIMLMAAAGVTMLSMAACTGTKCDKGASCSMSDKEVVYTGVLPAADCDGVRYTLHLDYDDDATKGDYKLVETYLQADTLSALGYKDAQTFASEGDFTVGNQAGKTYLRLVKDAKDSSAEAADMMYFVVDSDSTVTMANSDLEVSTLPGMNYTLKIAK